MDDMTAGLAEAVERLTVPLRMGDGVDETALGELSTLLTGLAEQWQGRADVPKEAAGLLVELYPAMVGAIGLYQDDQAQAIQDAAEQVLDLALACLATGGD